MPRTPKLHFIERVSEGDTDRQLIAMKKVFKLVPPEEADFLYLASFFKLNDAIKLKTEHSIPIVVYCWDYYSWKHDSEAQWRHYADFLIHHADLVIVPSEAQKLRLKELLGVDSTVIKTGIPTYEAKTNDGNYILDPVRYYEGDPNNGWAERAGAELGIPVIHSEHQYNVEDFRNLVANCTLLTCPYVEASTGGLSIMEGLYLGKPSLVSDSPYMGAVDYLGEYGYYFKYDDYEDFKKQIAYLWEMRPQMDVRDQPELFSYDQMAKKICEAVKNLKKD